MTFTNRNPFFLYITNQQTSFFQYELQNVFYASFACVYPTKYSNNVPSPMLPQVSFFYIQERAGLNECSRSMKVYISLPILCKMYTGQTVCSSLRDNGLHQLRMNHHQKYDCVPAHNKKRTPSHKNLHLDSIQSKRN